MTLTKESLMKPARAKEGKERAIPELPREKGVKARVVAQKARGKVVRASVLDTKSEVRNKV